MRYRLAALAGTAAFSFPEQAPWTLLFTLLAAISSADSANSRSRIITLLIIAGLSIGVVGGLLSAPFVTAVLAALAIVPSNRFLALGVLALHTSYAASLEAIAANHLFSLHLEATAPALLSGAMLLLVQPQHTWWRGSLAVLPLPIVWIATKFGLHPFGLMAVAAFPPMALAAFTPSATCTSLKYGHRWVIAGVVAIGVIGWMLTPPKVPSAGYVLLPGEMSNPEAPFYRNYQEVLRFAGLPLKVVNSTEEIPPDSLLLLPWLTATSQREGAPSFEHLRRLALERDWLVVMVGEHTDMGGAAARVRTVAGRQLLRSDLSVPPGNTDNSGHMRIADIRSWYPNAVLNRGASVDVKSPMTRILLTGDGWWSEPDIGEWLWVGDYMWQPGNRHGRLVMAASADEGRARWVVVGDTGPFINQQLVSDPRPAARVLELSTLWPLFVHDLGLFIIAFAIAFGIPIVALAGIIGLVVAAGLLPSASHDGPWRSLCCQESGFDERNFSHVLVESKQLLTTTWKLVRPAGPLSAQLPVPETQTVIFGLVDNELTVGSTTLSNCRRLGSLATDGLLLMDAQACKVEGDAEILIGDRSEAAILRVGSGNETLLLVLDQNFLGRNAPLVNRTWLEGQIKRQ